MNGRSKEPLPWERWFEGLDTDDGLRQRVTQRVDPPPNLHRMSAVAACEHLRDAWKNSYVPSDAHLPVLRQLVERARLSAARRIPSVCAYEAAIYSREPVVPQDQEIWGLTGLAGVGKSSAIKALLRAINPPAESWIAAGVQVAPQPIIHATIKSQRSSSPVLRSLANPLFVAGRTNINPPELAQHLRQWLYTQGTQLLLVDELQSMTRGENSTTLIANLVTDLNELGPCVTYIFNYSLGHKLLLRQQEDKDRLLVKCLSLDPPCEDDSHWVSVVTEHVRLAPELFDVDPTRDAPELHRLTAGLYRLLGFLLLQACRISWPSKVGRRVTMVDVRAAYESGAYTSQREDVEALRSLRFNARLRERRRDLVCPFPSPAAETATTAPVGRTQPKKQAPSPAAVHLLESALNVGSRCMLKELRAQAETATSGGRQPASVTRLTPRRASLTAEALLAGAKLLTDPALRAKSPSINEPAAED